MQESAVKQPPEGKVGESGNLDYQTPDIYDVSSLRIDSRLPELTIISAKDTVFTDSSKVEVTVKIPPKISGADIFLFNNGKKKDMFYQVGSGEYSFRNIFLDDSVNNLVFLYRLGSRRSLPANLVVIKESGR
ncbi:MAG TPA: hypothetical protein VKD08_16855 [Ignavibacteriaceae bacterium]|nr:hypothetical protein [Ignavibacteriaceae bacterium]